MVSKDQKKQRIECCRRQVERFEREGYEFLRPIITVDETWIKLYEPETKEQSICGKHLDHHPQRKTKLAPRRRSRCLTFSLTPRE